MPNSVIRELGAKADRELAVEARRLQNEIKIAVDERTVLAEIDRLVSSSLDIGLIYEQLIEQVKRLIPVEAAAIIVAYVASDSVTFEHITGTLMPGFEQRLVIPMSSFTDANQRYSTLNFLRICARSTPESNRYSRRAFAPQCRLH